MTDMKKYYALSFAATLLAGCSHNQELRNQISEIENRLELVEGEIASGTAEIGGEGRDIRTRLSYRPLQQWASDFGTKTFRFRQNDRRGDIEEDEMECSIGRRLHTGYRVWIHENESTRVDFALGPLSFTPSQNTLRFNAGTNIDLHTQLAGAVRPPCVGWTDTVTTGVDGHSRPDVSLQLGLEQQDGGFGVDYALSVVSPRRLDVEMRTGFQLPRGVDVDIRETVRFDNFLGRIAAGELSLLVDERGEVIMPNGEVREYRLATANPLVEMNSEGVRFETDVVLERD